MRNRLRPQRRRRAVLVAGLALAGGLGVGVPAAEAAPPNVHTECTPCRTCDVVVGTKHVPIFPAPCPPPP